MFIFKCLNCDNVIQEDEISDEQITKSIKCPKCNKSMFLIEE